MSENGFKVPPTSHVEFCTLCCGAGERQGWKGCWNIGKVLLAMDPSHQGGGLRVDRHLVNVVHYQIHNGKKKKKENPTALHAEQIQKSKDFWVIRVF